MKSQHGNMEVSKSFFCESMCFSDPLVDMCDFEACEQLAGLCKDEVGRDGGMMLCNETYHLDWLIWDAFGCICLSFSKGFT